MISHKSTPDYHEIVTEFEEYGKKEGGVQSASLSEEQIKGLIFLGIVVIAVVLIILLIVSILMSAKPVHLCVTC